MFQIIGHYEISRDGDVIRIHSSPEFNLEVARQYALDMLAQIKQMPPHFGTLVGFEAPPVIGPDAEESMRRSARERAAMGMVAVAFVTGSVDGISVAQVQWQRIYEGSGVVLQFFRDDAQARSWLQEQIDQARRTRG